MPTAVITLVTVRACHFCADAEQALVDLGAALPLRVERVAADSAAGRALVAAHRPAMFPLVLVDGGFFSAGRLPRRKLGALLAGRRRVASSS